MRVLKAYFCVATLMASSLATPISAKPAPQSTFEQEDVERCANLASNRALLAGPPGSDAYNERFYAAFYTCMRLTGSDGGGGGGGGGGSGGIDWFEICKKFDCTPPEEPSN